MITTSSQDLGTGDGGYDSSENGTDSNRSGPGALDSSEGLCGRFPDQNFLGGSAERH